MQNSFILTRNKVLWSMVALVSMYDIWDQFYMTYVKTGYIAEFSAEIRSLDYVISFDRITDRRSDLYNINTG